MDKNDIHYGDWTVVREIGCGSYGSVYEIEKIDYGVFKAALKVIHIPRSEEEERELRDNGMDEDSIRRFYEEEIEDLVKEFKYTCIGFWQF